MKEVNNIYVLTDDDIDRIIVAFNNDDYEWILYFFENLRKLKLKKQDVCCFMMHPDGDEDVLPVHYDMDLPLLIVQRISTLKEAKKKMKANTNYYKHYK